MYFYLFRLEIEATRKSPGKQESKTDDSALKRLNMWLKTRPELKVEDISKGSLEIIESGSDLDTFQIIEI